MKGIPAIEQRNQVEIDFWRDDPDEKPGVDSLANQLDKSADALVLYTALQRLKLPPEGAERSLELGAGQAWASCVLKRMRPSLHAMASDISEHAVASTSRWERVYNVALDEVLVCRSHELPVPSGTVDFLFCFAAAHHFVLHRETLREVARVLSPTGVAAYLYEPTAPRALYKLAVARVNAKRPHVPEDVLVPSEIRAAAKAANLACDIDYWPATLKRGGVASLYYAGLSVVPGLRRLLPCTANFVFRHA